MTTPRQIKKPTLTNAHRLSAIELNNLRFSDKHTLLTPERLKKASQPTPPDHS